MNFKDNEQSRDNAYTDLATLNPEKVLDEVQYIVSLLDPLGDFTPIETLFFDIARLFRGEFPGYRPCNTEYHDLKHTTSTLLAMVRLLHGATLKGVRIDKRSIGLGAASALFHDTGYIQRLDDSGGTGAKYTLTHIGRSIDFAERYLRARGHSEEDCVFCRNCLLCTGFSTKIKDIPFQSEEERLVGWMMGSADLLGQMADRAYLEKLLFLYREFKEGNIPGFGCERELLEKTLGFYEITRCKLENEFGNVQEYMLPHFAVRWNLNYDVYQESMRRNRQYLDQMILNAGDRYRAYLRREGLVKKLQREDAVRLHSNS